ncbi:hypothetical protein [Rhodopirellula bahusiensis]|uniref:Uncharacterized protein n=1 Tax=Rhodopirellula bahusiensis TaxID=2014065 RepID=A0A2G1W7L7_9BACT|nr:hypothetical protein [Rhodopirellula bahusiensis]PHQ35032.1 hypothetical protein CEE69_11415 [Rhodopirellula bahusiensis]
MDPNWETIRTKWPTYGIDQQDEFLVDASACCFAGEGEHEFAVYSFGRYTRRAMIDATATYPLCLQFGLHFPSFTSGEERRLDICERDSLVTRLDWSNQCN